MASRDSDSSLRKHFKDYLGPLGGTILGLIVLPVAIAQYPRFFNENVWLLPVSITVVIFCWVFPLPLHSRTQRIYRRITAIPKYGYPAFVVLVVLLFLGMFLVGRGLIRFHKRHLEAQLQKVTPPKAPITTPFPKAITTTAAPKSEHTKPAKRSGQKHPSPLNNMASAPAKELSAEPIPISAVFYDPQSPSIVVSNSSDEVAEGVVWGMVAFRASDLAYFGFATQSIGYIKPHSRSAYYSMDLANMRKASDGGAPMKDGDELTGSIFIDCPHCESRTYIIHLVWQHSGWFFEYPDKGEYIVPKDMSREGRSKYLQPLTGEAFAKDRVEIVPRPQ